MPTPHALAVVLAIEAEIRTADVEIVVGIADDGKEVLRKTGTRDQVSLDPTEVRRLRHAVITHNHPGLDVPFSLTDVRLGAMAEARQVRVVTVGATYSLDPPPSGWNLEWADRVLSVAYEQERRRLIPVVMELIRQGSLSIDVATETVVREAWIGVAHRLGMRYVSVEGGAE